MNLPHTEKFKEAWLEWLEYRKKERKKPIGEITAKRQLTLLRSVTEEEAILMIDKSINNGWQGIFPLRDHEKPQKPGLYV